MASANQEETIVKCQVKLLSVFVRGIQDMTSHIGDLSCVSLTKIKHIKSELHRPAVW